MLWSTLSSGVSSSHFRSRARGLLPALSLFALGACEGPVQEPESTAVAAAVKHKKPNGEELFETAFPGTNGRSCATCHVREDHTGLTPAHVAATLAANPADPLFNRHRRGRSARGRADLRAPQEGPRAGAHHPGRRTWTSSIPSPAT